MKLAAFGPMKENIAKQFAIFHNKHTWSMTALYIVTFGSFIGFSMALPLAIAVIFGVSHVPDAAGCDAAHAEEPQRPLGLHLRLAGSLHRRRSASHRRLDFADKWGGSLVTQIISAVWSWPRGPTGYVLSLAYNSATPEQYFPLFLGLILLLFFASGIGNGSTFRTIGVVFDRQQAGPVLGWTSAVAGYGAFIAPVRDRTPRSRPARPNYAIYGFAVFYGLCLILNWWFYLRRGAEIRNP
jgi:NNP family nitrate/nitrite transporter-like MFS transporter